MRQLKVTTSYTSPEIHKYLADINKIPLLTPEEEMETVKRIKEGDKEALDKLTKGNLKFVVSIAKQYQHN